MNDQILIAINKGAEIYCSISGGKDGQAMTKALFNNGIRPAGLIHADLGRVEWPQSMEMCERQSAEFGIPLHVVTRRDGRGLMEHWRARMEKLAGSGKPFWSSSKNRYCTSDLKRDVIDTFFRSRECNLIISCEGIRAGESDARALKTPLTIRRRISSTFYDGMTVEEALANYDPAYRLALTWYPIFNWSVEEVWSMYGNSQAELEIYRKEYKESGIVNPAWMFHVAYVFGNNRVSCMICILGTDNDIKNGAEHNPDLYQEMRSMEIESGFTVKAKKSLLEIVKN